MSFSTKDFDKWMKDQGPYVDVGGTSLSEEQVNLLKNYPECETGNDLPFNIQQDIIKLNDYDNLQNEVDAFLMNQYSLLSRTFKDFITRNREPVE
jgi:hypothetical protein